MTEFVKKIQSFITAGYCPVPFTDLADYRLDGRFSCFYSAFPLAGFEKIFDFPSGWKFTSAFPGNFVRSASGAGCRKFFCYRFRLSSGEIQFAGPASFAYSGCQPGGSYGCYCPFAGHLVWSRYVFQNFNLQSDRLFPPYWLIQWLGCGRFQSNLRDLMRSLNAAPMQTLRYLELPAALPVHAGGVADRRHSFGNRGCSR